MILRSIARPLAVMAAALVMTACGDNDFLEPPTNPSPPTIITETFSGTLTPNGARTHSFDTQASGTVTATLTALAPDNTVRVGLALGTWNGSTCQVIITNDDATEATTVTGAVSAVGSLCVRIFDAAGSLPASTDYEIRVEHP